MARPVKVAVDQTASIDPDTKARLGIETIPIRITGLPPDIEAQVNQGDIEALYRLLNAAGTRLQLNTQAGGVWEIKDTLEGLIKRFDCDIVCFVVSGRLSGIYENTLQAAQQLARVYPNRIVVFGEQAFLTLSLLARVTAEYAAAGRGMDEVLNFVIDKIGRGFVIGGLLDVRRLRRTGRVAMPGFLTALAQPVLKALGILPVFILETDRPQALAVIRKSQLERYVVAAIRQRMGFGELLMVNVAYTGGEVLPAAQKLQQVIQNQRDFNLAQPVIMERAGPVIGVHAGTALVACGALGLGYDALSTAVLLRFLSEAEAELRVFRQVVNAINVFPVRDGDTGSNLLAPLVNPGVGIDPVTGFPQALKQIAIRIAQRGGGYSGGAIAAYFLGFNDYVQRYEKGGALTLPVLVGALAAGTERCYEYFGDDAKEGTILSVMRAAAQGAKEAFNQLPTFRNVLVNAYLAATDELLNPRVQEVEVLREQGMVDAGGFGFTLLLWALLRTLGLHRDVRLQERYQLVLREVRRHAELGQRLIYRRQPEELRGFCVEGCVQGEVAEELKQAFLALNNRLPNPKMTFNVVNGTTHFHIHVSEGLEGEVQRIALRYGYALPPKPSTRLAKRRREIYQFRLVNLFRYLRRVPGYVVVFFANWVAYALLFPIMWYRSRQKIKGLQDELFALRLVKLALALRAREEKVGLLVLDANGDVVFNSEAGESVSGKVLPLEMVLGVDVARALRLHLGEMQDRQRGFVEVTVDRWHFQLCTLSAADKKGFLVTYKPLRS